MTWLIYFHLLYWNVGNWRQLLIIIIGSGHAKTCIMPYANNKGADQPAHSRSLINTFIVRYLRYIATGLPDQVYDWNALEPSGKVVSHNEIYVDPTWVDSGGGRGVQGGPFLPSPSPLPLSPFPFSLLPLPFSLLPPLFLPSPTPFLPSPSPLSPFSLPPFSPLPPLFLSGSRPPPYPPHSGATRKWKDTEPFIQFLDLLNFPLTIK